MNCGLDEQEEEEEENSECTDPEDCIEDDEMPMGKDIVAKTTQATNKAEYVALNPFKDLYKMSPVI